MKQLGLPMNTVKAIFVSHEHGDHIKGVSTLANKYSLPVYITPETAKHGPRLISHLAKPFTANEKITIGDLTITPFTKSHDAADPHSFNISSNGITVGVLTDIGTVCTAVIDHFKQCHAVFLEANYDEVMLENGKYPTHLKNRIRGGQGHLSNNEALDLFIRHRSPNLSHLLLSHLSKENNSPEIAEALFREYAGDIKITVASRHQPTAVFSIDFAELNNDLPVVKNYKPLQLGLFE
jgi:phosphoribosyl 1,2-cyclic phosphodiesterase